MFIVYEKWFERSKISLCCEFDGNIQFKFYINNKEITVDSNLECLLSVYVLLKG